MTRLIHTILLSWATLVVAREAKQQPATAPTLNQYTSQGCFNKLPAGAQLQKTKADFVSSGSCSQACQRINKFVAVTSPDGCHCADTYPPESALVKDAQCNNPCPGYAPEACGGEDPASYSIWNTGIKVAVDNDEGDGSSIKKIEATITISSITPPSTPLPSKLPTTTESSATESITAEGATAEDTTAVNTPTKGTATADSTTAESTTAESTTAESTTAESTNADSTNGAQGTPSSTATDIPSAAAPRLSSPVGKFIRMFKVFFN
ncbi:hypothetical protein N0V84_003909 [Fusarium piperis]|uniref:WSC domain-containing protein n=1 Tax=Fusarium piperis TaxID=1435070 RepID=A0A9W8WGG4_9HYPO|nr:hypothetical protein N0V84_003909 [Fusarium piperis]